MVLRARKTENRGEAERETERERERESKGGSGSELSAQRARGGLKVMDHEIMALNQLSHLGAPPISFNLLNSKAD